MGNCCVSSKKNDKPKTTHPKKTKFSMNGKEKMPSVSILSRTKISPPVAHKKLYEEKSRDFSKTTPRKQADGSGDSSMNPLGLRTVSIQKSSFDEQKAQALFTKYKDKTLDCISTLGTERLCYDLELDPTEFRVLLLAWKFNVSQMCRFTREEFIYGCRTLQVDSLSSLQSKLIDIEQDVLDKDKFRDLYRFTYGFGLDNEDGQRTLPTQVAMDLWVLVFTKNPPGFMKEWLSFLEEKQVKGISRDTWNMFLYLFETIEPDFSNYDDTEAWPSLFDEFVYKKKETEQDGH